LFEKTPYGRKESINSVAARLSRKKAIVVSAALLTFFIVGLTPSGPPDLLPVEISGPLIPRILK
jgi:hypothetical protein